MTDQALKEFINVTNYVVFHDVTSIEMLQAKTMEVMNVFKDNVTGILENSNADQTNTY